MMTETELITNESVELSHLKGFSTIYLHIFKENTHIVECNKYKTIYNASNCVASLDTFSV
jgi:hypothetical protein